MFLSEEGDEGPPTEAREGARVLGPVQAALGRGSVCDGCREKARSCG